jgi:hypothetical protein
MTLPPIIYVPPSPYTTRTFVALPPFIKAVRAGAVLMLDWATLHYIEHAPGYIVITTAIIALLVLGVIESRDWLQFRGRWYFPSFLLGLLMIYAAVCVSPYFFPIGAGMTVAEPPRTQAAPAADDDVPLQFSERQRQFFLALNNVFREADFAMVGIQNEAQKVSHDKAVQLHAPNGTPKPWQQVYAPYCRIIVSSTSGNRSLANLVVLAGLTHGCQAYLAPPPPPTPRPVDADAPTAEPIVIPAPASYAVVRYPNAADAAKMLETPYDPRYSEGRASDPHVAAEGAALRDSLADKITSQLRGCGIDARRSHKAEGIPGYAFDARAVYVDLGTVGPCR